MAYCIIVVLLLAFITAVCSNEVSSIDKLCHENLCMPYAKKSQKESYLQHCIQRPSMQYFPASNFPEHIFYI